MNRRYFLRALGVATGSLYLPSRFLLKAERFFEREHRPLLSTFTAPDRTILADEFGTLHIGDPYGGPTNIPTWREWFLEYQGMRPRELTKRFLDQEWDLGKADLDRQMSEDYYFGYWLRNESSTASAYHFLEGMDVGPELIDKNGEVVGELTFCDGPMPGNDSLIVQAEGDLALSCLQWRLERLGWKCNVEMV
jgi:hypothetical protein